MSNFFVVHQKQSGHSSCEHKKHLEEEAQPIKANHSAECRGRLAGLTEHQTDRHRNEQTTRGKPTYIAAFFFLPERFNDQNQHSKYEYQDFREDSCEHSRCEHYEPPSKRRIFSTPVCTIGTMKLGNKPITIMKKHRVVIATLSNMVMSVI